MVKARNLQQYYSYSGHILQFVTPELTQSGQGADVIVRDNGTECLDLIDAKYFIKQMPDPLREQLHVGLIREAGKWSGIRLDDRSVHVYGMRRYVDGASLHAHVDRSGELQESLGHVTVRSCLRPSKLSVVSI